MSDINTPDIPDTFATLATSMTNGMRDTGEKYVYGRIGTPTKYYNTQWGWTVLHGIVLIGGVLFWRMTLRNSGRPPKAVVSAWKNSSLAVISKGSTAAEELSGADTMVEMEKRA